MTDIDLKAITKNISKAKLTLMLAKKTTFFSALLSNLRLVIDTSHPTAAVDGITMWINPHFVSTLSKDVLLGLMLHEIMHVAFDHCGLDRLKLNTGLNLDILNIAEDHYINLYLKSLGYQLPKGAYADTKYRGMSSMQIYNELMKNPPDTSDYTPDVIGIPAGSNVTDHSAAVLANVIKAVTQAQIAKDPGSIPGDILRRVEEAINPQLPWQTILAPYLSDYAKEDYTMRKPNRRYLPEFFLPTMYSESLKRITAGCDVSLSMDQEDIDEIFSELVYIWDVFKPDGMRLMTFDTEVHLNEVFTEGDQLANIILEGGGGTNVQPLLDSIRKEEPNFALIFTDGYFGTPNMEGIHTDVFWIIKGNPGFKAPHGVVIPFD